MNFRSSKIIEKSKNNLSTRKIKEKFILTSKLIER